MNRFFRSGDIRFLFHFTVIIIISLYSVFNAGAEDLALKLLYASDLPDMETAPETGGLAELGTAVRQFRKTEDHFLFLHGGDSLAPSIMSSFDQGTHMIDILNSILPEVMAIDEREFAHSEDELIMRISEAGFPFISSNIIDTLTGKALEGIKEDKIFSAGGYKIGVFSILSSEVRETYLAERISVNSNPSFIEKKAGELRDRGADIVILLTGYSPENADKLLESGLVDLIIQSSTGEDRILHYKRGFYAVHGSSDGNCLVIDIKKTGKSDTSFIGSFVPLNKYKPDPEISEKINYYKEKLGRIMKTVVGKTAVLLDTTRTNVRTKENAFGNFAADSMRDYYGTDIAVLNGGSIRGNRIYDPGTEITRKTIQQELPFYNKVVPVYITGRQIIMMLEHGLSRIEEVNGGFLHVSGMNVRYDSDAEKGKRIKSVKIGDRMLDVKKGYTLAAIDFLLNGGDGFLMLKTALPVQTRKEALYSWEVLRHYIEKKQIISPEIEGRLIDE